MAQPYIGEIRLFGGNFAPVGWSFCNGVLIAISQNAALFNLIGTTYGGDGVNSFALPNLQSRVPIHMGQGQGLQNYVIGQSGGVEQVALTAAQVAVHSHGGVGSTGQATANPQNATWGNSGLVTKTFANPSNNTMNATGCGPAGNNLPHDNLIPFLVVSFIIALFGVFPSQS
jgi:microcystin-dependent protein